MAAHSSVLAWRTAGTEEPGGLPSIRLRRVDTTEVTWQQQEGPAYPRAIFSAVSRPATPPHPSASAVPAPSPLGASLMPLMPTALHVTETMSYGLNCVPQNSYAEVLTPSTSEADCIWRCNL